MQKLMETLLQENKRLEIIIGNLIKLSIDLDMENNGYSMELLCQFIMKDLIKVSPKL